MMYPNNDQWTLFERYKNCPPPMSPQAFLQRWQLDYPDLARLMGVTRNTVAHWFSSGVGSRCTRTPLSETRDDRFSVAQWRSPAL